MWNNLRWLFHVFVIEQVLVAVLVIAVTFGAESELKLRIGDFGSAADGTFMLGYAFGCGLPSYRISEFSGLCRSLHSLSGGAETSVTLQSIENNKVKESGSYGDLGICIAHNKQIYHICAVNISEPLHLDREQEHNQYHRVGEGQCKRKENRHIDIISRIGGTDGLQKSIQSSEQIIRIVCRRKYSAEEIYQKAGNNSKQYSREDIHIE